MSVRLVLASALLAPPVLALASGLAFDPGAPSSASFPIEAHGFETAGLGQPLVVLLAALVAGSDTASGALRTILLATPRRGAVVGPVIVVVAALGALIGLVATASAVIVKQSVIGSAGLSLDRFTTGMAWNLLGVAVNYALIAILAASITLIARSIVATLVILVPLVLGIGISLLGAVPLLRFLPDLAGMQLLTPYPGVGLLDPIPGGLVMALWAGAAATIAGLWFSRRDVGTE